MAKDNNSFFPEGGHVGRKDRSDDNFDRRPGNEFQSRQYSKRFDPRSEMEYSVDFLEQDDQIRLAEIKKMRAAAANFTMARMLGVPANLIISSAFAISGFLGGVVGILWIGRIGTVVPGIGLEPLLVAFIATVIGGMRSMQGAVIGGFLLALIDTTLNYTLPQDLLKFRDAFTFTLVILILLWRPEGLIRGPATGQRT